MEQNYAKKYYSADEASWWFLARRDIIWKLIKKMPFGKDVKILDYGCGGGYIIRFLNKKGYKDIYGAETSGDAVKSCRESGLTKVFLDDDASLKSQEGLFDVIIASDVIEHIRDDKEAIRKWKKFLKPGGFIIIFAPAFGFLWGAHDKENYHFRRYNAREIKHLLETEGFSVDRISYWNFALFFPVVAMTITKKIIGFIVPLNKKSNRPMLGFLNISPPRFINMPLSFMLKTENIFLSRLGINLPFGMSVFAVAKTKE